MKIAVFLDNQGNTESLNTQGIVSIYEKTDDKWEVIDSFEFDLSQSQGIGGMRKAVADLIEKLDDCEVLVGDKVIGIAYNMLDRGGFHIWELKGKPENFLDIVEQKEVEMEKMLNSDSYNVTDVVELSDGRFYMNIKEILQNDESKTSKKLLKPFFTNEAFYELHVVFSHIPPWLEAELKSRNLKMEVIAQSVGEVQVLIQNAVCYEE